MISPQWWSCLRPEKASGKRNSVPVWDAWEAGHLRPGYRWSPWRRPPWRRARRPAWLCRSNFRAGSASASSPRSSRTWRYCCPRPREPGHLRWTMWSYLVRNLNTNRVSADNCPKGIDWLVSFQLIFYLLQYKTNWINFNNIHLFNFPLSNRIYQYMVNIDF